MVKERALFIKRGENMTNNVNTQATDQVICKFMEQARLNEAFLFGGAVLDPLINPNAKINDYDVCVKDKDTFFEALQNLEAQGIPISEVTRTHNIYVVIQHPEFGQIDFSCMDPENNGIFNIEKIYKKYRKINGGGYDSTIIDKYGAVEGLKRGEIRLACNPEEEGAYNLLRRFLAVTGKYSLDISKDGPNQAVINDIKDEFRKSRPHIPQDRVRCLSRLSASLRRSKNRNEYVKNLGSQGIFFIAFPDIHKLFNRPSFQTSPELAQSQTQKELLELMLAHTKKEDRDAMIDCLRILAKREPARQDKGVKMFVENLEQEKTSPARLSKEILTPLFVHILSAQQK